MDRVIIWGNGNYYRCNIVHIKEMYDVLRVVDSYIVNECEGVFAPESGFDIPFDKVIVMIRDVKAAFDVVNRLHRELGVDYKTIILGLHLFPDPADVFSWGEFDHNGRINVSINEFKLKIGSFNEYYNVYEVLFQGGYGYYINNGKTDIVIDIGMNIGDSVLFFLNNERVHKIFAYEPFEETYKWALDNIKDRDGRVETFKYGISDRTEFRRLSFNPDMPGAQSTIADIQNKVSEDFRDRGLNDVSNDKKEVVELRDAAEVLRGIFKEYGKEFNYVLKMDCEGEEYRILSRLDEQGLLSHLNLIMMEWHYRGNEAILRILKQNVFSFNHSFKSKEMGQVYAWR